ncbi:MAG TPA: hypothetical protein VE465_03915, partial [Streptosporangiaceae bacterium]|nr:hypothetical protein [Streptosporangiaceae bacterium]
MSNEIHSSGNGRIRRGFDWTVRRHPSVAAGVAGAAITLAGAYVAVHADDGGENVAATRRPPAAGAAPAVPPSGGDAKPTPPAPGAESRPTSPRRLWPESPPRSGPGAPPGIPHSPLSRAGVGSGAGGDEGDEGEEASGPVRRP